MFPREAVLSKALTFSLSSFIEYFTGGRNTGPLVSWPADHLFHLKNSKHLPLVLLQLLAQGMRIFRI